jgi:hypothetical protein
VPPPVMTAIFPAKSFMGFAHLSVHAVSDRPPDLMFTWQRAATQAASHVLAARVFGGTGDYRASQMSNL